MMVNRNNNNSKVIMMKKKISSIMKNLITILNRLVILIKIIWMDYMTLMINKWNSKTNNNRPMSSKVMIMILISR